MQKLKKWIKRNILLIFLALSLPVLFLSEGFVYTALCVLIGFVFLVIQGKVLHESLDDLQSTVNQMKTINQNLNDANKKKDELLGILGHDLTSPVSQIKMLIERGQLEGVCTDDDTLKKASLSTDRALALIRNITDWVRSHWESSVPVPIEFDLSQSIKSNFEQLLSQATEKKISIFTEFHDCPRIFCDQDMFITILRNLLQNAIKFSPINGTIAISSYKEKDSICVAVADAGIGIPEDKLKTLFLVDRSKIRRGTMREPGTGLGLLLCQDIAKRMGGLISVSSVEGKGSTFTIHLPAPSVS